MDTDAVYVNEFVKRAEPTRPDVDSGAARPQRTRCRGPAVVSLALLVLVLLAALVGLGVHQHHCVAVAANLTERLRAADARFVSLTAELANKTKELQGLIPHVAPCPRGWTMLQSSCYSLSSASGSWFRGRNDCRERGGHLVVISSTEEQSNISKMSNDDIWIGLSDGDRENAWKWTDGSPLTLTFWRHQQPDNGKGQAKYGEEDCVMLCSSCDANNNWNDLRCDASLNWICEKKALVLSEI